MSCTLDGSRRGISRRGFVGAFAAGVVALRGTRAEAATRYRVARINSNDPYSGTMNALAASGEFPDVAGRSVVIKPNLVLPRTSDTGVTTDPEVVRAVVDQALALGAAGITIVEAGVNGANFSGCGYDLFNTYDPRVALADVSFDPGTFTLLPHTSASPPQAYGGIYLPAVVLDPGTVFISVGKLKTHQETMATLSLKNLFGLPPFAPYLDPTRENFRPRYLLHDRSVGQAIAGLALARPIDYAVVDGVWGLEGDGPADITGGTPVRANTIVAGSNAVAVDVACLDIMGISRETVQHLDYAYLNGLGPYDLRQIDLVGDVISIPAFARPSAIPLKIWFPKVNPTQFSPGTGGKVAVAYQLLEAAQVQVQILLTTDRLPSQTAIRALQPWADMTAGVFRLSWDGRDEAGRLVPPGVYGVRAQTRRAPSDTIVGSGINWTMVMA